MLAVIDGALIMIQRSWDVQAHNGGVSCAKGQITVFVNGHDLSG